MLRAGDIIPYLDMCREEGVNLQRGMNFRLSGRFSVILMSIRRGAPYADRVEDDGRVLIYEGHDASQLRGGPNPKTVDQPMFNPGGGLTQNGLFFKSALDYKTYGAEPKLVKVYEKIHSGIWVYNGVFKLVDAWQEVVSDRKVFKFRLELTNDDVYSTRVVPSDFITTRVIPAAVKLTVWKRDKGKCVICDSTDNLHFDHVIPYSKGGSSLIAKNIQILCARHNLEKHDKIE